MRILLIALAVLASAAPVVAAEASLRALLADGFEIRSAEAIPKETLNRAINAQWQDGYFILLQKADRIAMCHGLLSNTTDAQAFADLTCTVSDPGNTAN
ncbi:MAG TPA: hypothetical protein GYA10_12805 [Alphaproteobacteria bacterium]|nr:hypothetical protein [Alphaproteobacteria bacterium]